MRTLMKVAFAAAGVGMIVQPALAQDKVKVATTFLGLWDTSQPTLCQERGEFTTCSPSGRPCSSGATNSAAKLSKSAPA